MRTRQRYVSPTGIGTGTGKVHTKPDFFWLATRISDYGSIFLVAGEGEGILLFRNNAMK